MLGGLEKMQTEKTLCSGTSSKFIDLGRKEASTGFGKPPWIFKGSALYQLHLVKAETARSCIPEEFRLVEAFGYTLGGFFLANYDHSPAGVFDELVVIAGLVWSPPTSCAWATKVLVNSDEACVHGRKEVGLPSQIAKFSKSIKAIAKEQKITCNSRFLNMMGFGANLSASSELMDVLVTEVKQPAAKDICAIKLTSLLPAFDFDKWMGPAISLSLPSFSGGTEHNPHLLKYSCKINCRVRAVRPVKVSGSVPTVKNDLNQSLQLHNRKAIDQSTRESPENGENLSIAVMLSKPILALKFSSMTMQVEAPIVISESCKLRTC